MATYPLTVRLPYLVSSAWVEERTLAGQLVEPDHLFVVELDRLDDPLRDRATALARRVGDVWADGRHAPIGLLLVVGSGLTPTHHTVRDQRRYNACFTVAQKIGALPELPEPTDDPETIISAYETWLGRYDDLSFGALATFIQRTAPEGDLKENTDFPDHDGMWSHTISIADATGYRTEVVIDGRTDPELFQQAAGAAQIVEHARETGGKEHLAAAERILGAVPVLETSDARDVVTGFRAHCQRLADFALARAWTTQRQKAGFEAEMLRWVREHGSERLRLGVEEGYRMMPVYLAERISVEVPGFYAHLPKDGETRPWQERSGPSEEALKLRRAVQDRVNTHEFHGAQPPKVQIGWMKTPPPAMIDVGYASRPRAGDGGFEVLVIPDWLGRYVLFAAVWTLEDEQPPDFVLLKHILDPRDYGLADLPSAPRDVDTDGRPYACLAEKNNDIPF